NHGARPAGNCDPPWLGSLAGQSCQAGGVAIGSQRRHSHSPRTLDSLPLAWFWQVFTVADGRRSERARPRHGWHARRAALPRAGGSIGLVGGLSMDAHRSSSERRLWLLRSMALTVALGAALLGFAAQRPGYLGFALISTLGFFLAGLLWTGGSF